MENSGGTVSYYKKMDGLALWFEMSVAAVFFASLDCCACVNVATYNDEDEEEAAPALAFSDLAEKAHYATRDPITALKKYMAENKLASEAELKAIEKKIDELVEDAVEFADKSLVPARASF